MNNVGLFLMGEKGYEVLMHIHNINKIDSIKFVVSERDLNIKKDFFDEIKRMALDEGVPFYSRKDFTAFNINVNFSIAIGWKWLLDIKKLIVLHDSLLPKYRGFNPLVTALIEGDKTIGVTSLFANDEMDNGNIIFQEKIDVNYPLKIQNAIEAIVPLYKLIVERILNQPFNELTSTPQNQKEASYSIWRDNLDYFIDWNNNASYINRFVNSVGYPYAGAMTTYEGETIIIEEVEEIEDLNFINRTVGKIFKIDSGEPIVLCSKGLIKIKKAFYHKSSVQVEFKKVRVRLC